MATSSTPNRNYTHPEKDEDLESSNGFFRINLFAIDADVQNLFDNKANSTDVYLKTETYSQTETNTRISNDISAISWTTGDVRGNTTELNLRTDTMATPGVYSSVSVNDKGLVTAGSSIINDSAPALSTTYSSTKVESTVASLIDDVTPSSSKVYSSTKVDSLIGGVDPSGSYVLLSDYSDLDVLNKLLNVDGTTSGLDSDLLDGEDGVFYLDWTNFSSTPTTLAGYGITDKISLNKNFSITPSATTDIDFSNGEVQNFVLDQDITLTTSNLIDGSRGSLIFKQDATGNHTITFGTEFKFPGGAVPTLSTTADSVDKIDFVISGIDILCTFANDFK